MNTPLRLLALAGILLARPVLASIVEYTVDTSASFVTATGTFQGIPFTEQTPGSSTAHYSGFFLAELENGLLAIDGNSTVALHQPDPLPPIPASDNGGHGAYGFRLTLPDSSEVLLAITGVSFYLNTGFRPPLDIADGFFAPSDIGFFLHGDTLLLSGETIPFGFADLHGTGAPNTAAAPGTFTNDGTIETLTIPITTTFSSTALAPDDLSLTFTGQIVATRPVPEPTTTALLLLGGCGSLFWSRRRRL